MMLENYIEEGKNKSMFNTYKKRLESLNKEYENKYNKLIGALEKEIETNLVGRWVHFSHESGNMEIYSHVSGIKEIYIEEEKGISIECDIVVEKKTYGNFLEINREKIIEYWIEDIDNLKVVKFESVKNLLLGIITSKNLIDDKG